MQMIRYVNDACVMLYLTESSNRRGKAGKADLGVDIMNVLYVWASSKICVQAKAGKTTGMRALKRFSPFLRPVQRGQSPVTCEPERQQKFLIDVSRDRRGQPQGARGSR